MTTRPVWRNWGRSVACTPAERVRATSTQDVIDVLQDARANGTTVRPVGSGHSFTALAATDSTQLDLSGLQGVHDLGDGLVSVGAGTPLWRLGRLLEPLGLSMPNMGDIDRQTLAGALATGTHGTGLRHGGLATQVAGLTLVDGTGAVRRVGAPAPGGTTGATTPPDAEVPLEAAAVSLGALGVVTEVTLRLVPSLVLHAQERREPLSEVLGGWAQRAQEADHFELYWFPGTQAALTKTNTRLPGSAPLQPLGRLRRLVDDELLGNGAYELMCRAGHARPSLVPALNRLAAATIGSRDFTDASTKVFVSPRRVRFIECEYAVPFEAVPSLVADLQRLIERRRWRIGFPIEVRAAAADDLWLSTAHGRASGYVAVHRYHREDPGEYFAAFEELAAAYEGRPHWGKVHSLGHERLRELYPRMDDFTALRDRLDPGRVLANEHLTRVLGG